MKPWKHAQISARKSGGVPEDYILLHNWFDHSKAHIADVRHRAALHNAWGCFVAEQVFRKAGPNLQLSDGKTASIRDIAEQHVLDDLHTIPSLGRCLDRIDLQAWFVTPSELDLVTQIRESRQEFGGVEEDYINLHQWFLQTDLILPDSRHRAVLYTSFGIGLMEQVFGPLLENGISTRSVARSHITRVIGRVPSLAETLSTIPLIDETKWLGGPIRGRKMPKPVTVD